MLTCWKTLQDVSPLRGSDFRWEPITWGRHGWHPSLLHATPPAFQTSPYAGMLVGMVYGRVSLRFSSDEEPSPRLRHPFPFCKAKKARGEDEMKGAV
jgi:hypothetical protein